MTSVAILAAMLLPTSKLARLHQMVNIAFLTEGYDESDISEYALVM